MSSGVTTSAKERLRVAVRVRPLSERESTPKDNGNLLSLRSYSNNAQIEVPFDLDKSAARHPSLREDPKRPAITTRKEPRKFQFDNVFWSVKDVKDASGLAAVGQREVYESIGQPLVEHAFSGFNSCLFAYGQTGSGKTYTMMGPDVMSLEEQCEEAGIIPRVCEDIFRRKAEAERDGSTTWSVELGYVEVYNERVSDLLARRKKGREDEDVFVEVRENPAKGVYLDGQKFVAVESVSEVLQVLEKGNELRHTASTKMNNRSSRSHAILMITLKEHRLMKTKSDVFISTAGVSSRMNLVDLAGSERVSQSEVEGMQFNEATHINLSLTTLGRVIDILADVATNPKGNSRTAVPFRESKLTHILKESLKGNSKTFMVATVSPSLWHTSETVSTLRYASRAREIVNVVQVNEDPRARKIRELEEEIERLRAEKNSSGDRSDREDHTAVVMDLQRRIALLSSEAEQRAAELQMFEKERERAKVQQELLNATATEKDHLQQVAQQLKEEVERSRRQADEIFAENTKLTEEYDRLEQHWRQQLEAKQAAFSILRRDREQRVSSAQEQVEEAQRQLQLEREERHRLEEQLEEQQAHLRSALSQSMEGSAEKKLLMDENLMLSLKVTRLVAELQEKDRLVQRMGRVESQFTELQAQHALLHMALQEMEQRHRNTTFFLLTQLDLRAQLEDRQRHHLHLEFERDMSQILQDAVVQEQQQQSKLLEMQHKYTEALQDKNELRSQVETLHQQLSDAETHILALQMEANSSFQLRDTTMRQLEGNLQHATIQAQSVNTEREAMRQELLAMERERNELRTRLKAHRDRARH